MSRNALIITLVVAYEIALFGWVFAGFFYLAWKEEKRAHDRTKGALDTSRFLRSQHDD